jgi:hypothetical protein
LDDHVHRYARLGASVLISESWYKAVICSQPVACCALNAMGASWWRSNPWLITSWAHDQMVLGVDGGLYIVADHAGSAPAGSHRPRIRIGQRDLLVGRDLNRLPHRLRGLHLATQAGDLKPRRRRQP